MSVAGSTYTLLITTNKLCKRCFKTPTHILLGLENELLGFYCETCGLEQHKLLEEKHSFIEENKRKTKPKKRKIKRYHTWKKNSRENA